MQEAIRNAAERQEKVEAKYKAEGEEFYGLCAGWVDSPVGTVKVSFVQAASRVHYARHRTRKIWHLAGKRIAHDKLVKALDAAYTKQKETD